MIKKLIPLAALLLPVTALNMSCGFNASPAAPHVNSRYNNIAPAGFVAEWGGNGTGNGQFLNPSGIACNSAGSTLYVADFSANRVQAFDKTGKYLFQFGGAGAGNGQFQGPAGVALNSQASPSTVYVADSLNNRVEAFDPSGNFLVKWGAPGAGSGQFNFPNGVAVNSANGEVLVADTYNGRVDVFNASGTPVAQWTAFENAQGAAATFLAPRSVAVNTAGTLVFVTDMAQGEVGVLDGSGNPQTGFGSPGYGPGQFSVPNGAFGIAVNSAGVSVYVADFFYTVSAFCYVPQPYIPPGIYLQNIGSNGLGDSNPNNLGSLNGPSFLALDGQGYLYVSNYYDHVVDRFFP